MFRYNVSTWRSHSCHPRNPWLKNSSFSELHRGLPRIRIMNHLRTALRRGRQRTQRLRREKGSTDYADARRLEFTSNDTENQTGFTESTKWILNNSVHFVQKTSWPPFSVVNREFLFVVKKFIFFGTSPRDSRRRIMNRLCLELRRATNQETR